ncbi:hypothetical protein [Rathayibacter rathayi]|uniref:Ppx/GppA phosphatase family protein n=1 Tax=Rathayibacter rathayi TaxID=33887 RepID=UPI0030B95CC7
MLGAAGCARCTAAPNSSGSAAAEAGAEHVRFVAASATRDAADREDFLAAVERILGVAPEMITGEEEARLSFRGAVSAVESARPVLVLDGGSIELVLGGAERRRRRRLRRTRRTLPRRDGGPVLAPRGSRGRACGRRPRERRRRAQRADAAAADR